MGVAWLLCIAGGGLMGSYPVFIKVPRVVAAHVNPIIFQSHKSFWVFVLAWIFLLVNCLRSRPLFVFTWWGVAAAALWVPAGFATIAAVSMCGVATTAVFSSFCELRASIPCELDVGSDHEDTWCFKCTLCSFLPGSGGLWHGGSDSLASCQLWSPSSCCCQVEQQCSDRVNTVDVHRP